MGSNFYRRCNGLGRKGQTKRRLIQNPFSTYSSGAFLAAAVAMSIIDPSATGLLVALGVLTVGSAVFHGEGEVKGTAAHVADVSSVYAVALELLPHVWRLAPAWQLVAGALALAMVCFHRRVDLFVALPVLAGLAIAGVGVNAGWIQAGISLAVFTLAVVVRILLPYTDRNHAAWHVLVTTSIFAGWWFTLAT